MFQLLTIKVLISHTEHSELSLMPSWSPDWPHGRPVLPSLMVIDFCWGNVPFGIGFFLGVVFAFHGNSSSKGIGFTWLCICQPFSNLAVSTSFIWNWLSTRRGRDNLGHTKSCVAGLSLALVYVIITCMVIGKLFAKVEQGPFAEETSCRDTHFPAGSKWKALMFRWSIYFGHT